MGNSTNSSYGGLAILVGCLLFGGCDHQASTDELISRATQYMQQGDYKSATIELKNAVASDVNNARARWLLGKTYFESGELESAEKELTKARELGAPAGDVLPLLAQALGALGKQEELMALSPEGLPTDAQAVVLSAQALTAFERGDANEAGKRVEQALAADPQSVYARVANVRLLFANRQVDTARKQLDEVLADKPGYAPAWTLLGDIEQKQQHPDLAEKAYTKALEIEPNNFGDRLKRALIRIQAGQAEQATQDIAVLRRASPKHPGVFFATGLLHMQKNELEEAKSAFEQTARVPESFPLALFYLSAIHAQQGNQAQAETYVAQFLTLAPGNPLGRSLAGSLALRAGDFVRAEDLVRPVVAANGEDAAAINTLAAALLAQGKTDEGLDLLTKVAELQPDSALAQTRLAAGLLAAGQGDVGVEYLQKALSIDPGFQQADVLLVLNHLRQQDLEGALEAAEAYRARNPDAVTPYNVLGRVHLAASEPDEARQAFAKALEIAPGDPAASQSLAALAVQEKDYDAARRYYNGVLEKHPDYVPVHLQLAALDLTQGNEDAMVERLRQTIKAYPEAAEPPVALARYYMGRGKMREALGLLGDLSSEHKTLPSVLTVTAAAQLAQSDYATAKSTLDRLVQMQPNVAEHHYQLAMAAAGMNDAAGMQKELGKAIELDSNHLPSRVALARSFLLQREIAKFEVQLVELRKIQPEHPDVLLLESALARTQGKDKEALANLERAYASAPSQMTVLSLALEKMRQGDKATGRKLLEDWVARQPGDTAVRMALADVYAANQLVDSAIEQYRIVLEKDARNAVALNNLAWHLRKSDPKQALVYAQSAAEITPESADVMDTLALAHLENKDFDEAQSSIEKALKLKGDNPAIRYHAALIRSARGDKGGAILILKPLVSGANDFPEKQEATQLLTSLEKK